MNAWQPISSAPKDGTRIVCWREGWEFPEILMWKHNSRIEDARKTVSGWDKYAEDYFGDPEEMDDYDLASGDEAPTHWHPIFPLPKQKSVGLVSVYGLDGARNFLYELMEEREPEINISHRAMPTWAEHTAFVESKPYRLWYLIVVEHRHVGYISATDNNEIGIVIRKAHRGLGYGSAAIRMLMAVHEPLPPIPSKRNGAWLANIAPSNEHSRHTFEKLGFRIIQSTYALNPEEEQSGKEGKETPA